MRGDIVFDPEGTRRVTAQGMVGQTAWDDKMIVFALVRRLGGRVELTMGELAAGHRSSVEVREDRSLAITSEILEALPQPPPAPSPSESSGSPELPRPLRALLRLVVPGLRWADREPRSMRGEGGH